VLPNDVMSKVECGQQWTFRTYTQHTAVARSLCVS